MAEFHASFIYEGADYTPNEPRPDGKGWQSKRITAESAAEAAKIAKRDFVAEHAARTAEGKVFISPAGCHTIAVFNSAVPGLLGVSQFRYDEVVV